MINVELLLPSKMIIEWKYKCLGICETLGLRGQKRHTYRFPQTTHNRRPGSSKDVAYSRILSYSSASPRKFKTSTQSNWSGDPLQSIAAGYAKGCHSIIYREILFPYKPAKDKSTFKPLTFQKPRTEIQFPYFDLPGAGRRVDLAF